MLYEIVRDATDEQLAILHSESTNRSETMKYLLYLMFGVIVLAGGMMYYMLATCKSGQKQKSKQQRQPKECDEESIDLTIDKQMEL